MDAGVSQAEGQLERAFASLLDCEDAQAAPLFQAVLRSKGSGGPSGAPQRLAASCGAGVAAYNLGRLALRRHLRHLTDTSWKPPRHLWISPRHLTGHLPQTPRRHIADTSQTPRRHLADTSQTHRRHIADTSQTPL